MMIDVDKEMEQEKAEIGKTRSDAEIYEEMLKDAREQEAFEMINNEQN